VVRALYDGSMELTVLRSTCLAFALALWPYAAGAQDASADPESTPNDSRDAEARTLFEAGRIAFRDGRYEDARSHFRRSYELSHRAELLYNIASTDDRLRRDEEALAGFEEYLRLVPLAENRSEVEARIDALRAAMATRAPTTTAPDDPAPSGPTVLWTWVLGGLSLASTGLAVGFWVAANDQYASLERRCLGAGPGCSREDVVGSGIEDHLTLTNVLLVSAIATGVAAAVALPLELTLGGSETDTRTVGVTVSPMGASFWSRF